MVTRILMCCTFVLALTTLVLACASYLTEEPIQVCPNRLVERPMTHPADLPKPTLVVPGKS